MPSSPLPRPGAVLSQFRTAQQISKPIPAYEQVLTQADITFDAACSAIEAGQVDILIVPGAGPDGMEPAKKDLALLNLIKTFVNCPSAHPRTLISICTGAELCGLAGAFRGKTATTHWAALSTLQEICGDTTTVVRKRWVDGGVDTSGLRVISSGGISCGIDACLYLVSQKLDTQTAVNIAQMMDYDWKAPHLGLQPGPGLMNIGLTPTGWTTNQW